MFRILRIVCHKRAQFMSRVVTDSFSEFYLYSNLTYVVELYLESYRKVYTESVLHTLLESLSLFLMKQFE